MNDYTAIADTLKNTSNINILIIFISINVLVSLVQIYAGFRLKSKDRLIYSQNLKEKRRIKTIEELFRKLENLTYFDGRKENDNFLKEISELDAFVTKNRLYIDKKYLRITNEINDYFRTVLSDFRKKDFKREQTYFDNFLKIFNK